MYVERNDKGRKKRGLSFHQMQKKVAHWSKNSKVFQTEVKMQSLKDDALEEGKVGLTIH